MSNSLKAPLFKFIVTSLLLLSTGAAQALSTDRDQPAEIEADDIEFDFQKGTRTYLQNVLVVQGTLRIKADKLIAVYDENDELETVTAWGNLARFKQRPDGKQNDVEGWAKKILVNQKANTLTLIGQAALKQGPDTARSDTIVYDMERDKLSLSGGAKVGAAGKDGSTVADRKADPFDDASQGPAAPKAAKIKKSKPKSDSTNSPEASESKDVTQSDGGWQVGGSAQQEQSTSSQKLFLLYTLSFLRRS